MEESPSLVSWPLLITADLKLNQKVKTHVQRSTSWSGLWSLLISWHQTGSWARCTGSRIGMPSGSEQHLSFEYHFLQVLLYSNFVPEIFAFPMDQEKYKWNNIPYIHFLYPHGSSDLAHQIRLFLQSRSSIKTSCLTELLQNSSCLPVLKDVTLVTTFSPFISNWAFLDQKDKNCKSRWQWRKQGEGVKILEVSPESWQTCLGTTSPGNQVPTKWILSLTSYLHQRPTRAAPCSPLPIPLTLPRGAAQGHRHPLEQWFSTLAPYQNHLDSC